MSNRSASAGDKASATAEALGCGDAANLHRTLGRVRPRNLGLGVLLETLEFLMSSASIPPEVVASLLFGQHSAFVPKGDNPRSGPERACFFKKSHG